MSATQGEVRTTVPGSGRAALPRRRRSARVGYGYWWWALPALVLTIATVYITTASGAFFAFTNWTGVGSFDFQPVEVAHSPLATHIRYRRAG